MIFRARTVWIRSEWAFVFQTRLSLDVSFRTIGVAGQPFDEELEDTARFLVSAVHSILEMTKRQFRYKILRVAVVLALYAILGVFLYGHSQHSKNHLYPIYKDLMSLIIAIAASYLGFAYQRRQSYLQALRDLWNRLIPAVYRAVECARNDQPASSQFSEVIRELDTVIDSLRGVFENIPNGTALGLYPYEPLKDIRTLVYWLSEGRNAEERHLAERCIRQLWYDVHSRMLQEFDREVPIYYVSKYLDVPPLSIADKLIKGMSLRGDLRD
jgi:hypothetical protein